MSDIKKIESLKNEYNNIEIPSELDNMVKNTLKKQTHFKTLYLGKTGVAAAVIIVAFTTAVNISPTFAESMTNIPVLSSIVKLVNFKTYTAKNDNMEANINVAQVEGLKNKELEKQLNNEFLKEGQQEYGEFLKEMKAMEGKNSHKSVETSYQVKTDNDRVYSIVYTKFEASGSSDTQYKTYTIDKKNQAVVSLKSLFKDNSYIDVISNYIKDEMKKEMKADSNKIYFIDSTDPTDENFDKIKADQTFYINNNGNIVIMFNKYEVAPGYMGTPEFIIPNNVVKGILLDRGIVK